MILGSNYIFGGAQSNGVITLVLSGQDHALFAYIQYGCRTHQRWPTLIHIFDCRISIFMILGSNHVFDYAQSFGVMIPALSVQYHTLGTSLT